MAGMTTCIHMNNGWNDNLYTQE